MRVLVGLIFATSLGSVATAAIQAEETANLSFSRSASLYRFHEQVHVGFLRRDPATGSVVLWARLVIQKNTAKPIVSWTDSKNCPALTEVMRKLRELEMPRPLPLGIGAQETDIVLDGSAYRLKAQASYRRDSAEVELMTNVGTPLAQWVDQSLDALSPCWKDREPEKH